MPYKSKEDVRAYHRNYCLVKNYGITSEQWDLLFEAQGKKCALCESSDPRHSRGWHTDHCHETGRIRGILCKECNVSLGKFKDNPGMLRKAIDYLEGDNAQVSSL